MNTSYMHPADQLVMFMQRIYDKGLTTTSGGNLSIRDESGDVWITPAGIGPVLWQIWTEGYGTECRYETRDNTETLAVYIEGEDGIFLETWFHRETGLPLACNVMENGMQALFCSFSNVTLG